MGAVVSDVADADVGLPSGTAALAVGLAEHAARRAGELSGQPYAVCPDAVLAHLLLPLVVGARPPGGAPRPAPGGGFVHDDTRDDDAGLVAALADDGPGAEEWAGRAQACWLPVTPYRALAAGSGAAGSGAACLVADDRPAIVRRRDPGSVNVLDLTAMWAGPLCTLLLAEWGARVTTVEPSVRTDGLRGSPAQFAVLDRHKERVDLDLRTTPGRAAFELLVAEADVLVESFSARVMPNLGYDAGALRAVNPRLTTVSIRAYAGCEWVAYGRGVHATSGLGMINGRPQPASIAYPDPLTGFAAFAATLEALGAAEPPVSVEVSLAATIAPLAAAGERPLSPGAPAAVARLAARTGGATTAPLHPIMR